MSFNTLTFPYFWLLRTILNFVYPKVCEFCSCPLKYKQKRLCSYCLTDLENTNFSTWDNNDLYNLLNVSMILNGGVAVFYFRKGSKVQQYLHRFKYGGESDLGKFFAYLIYQKILRLPQTEFDAITYIPTTEQRIKKRGYNQARVIAEHLGEYLHLPVVQSLHKDGQIGTQIKLSAAERFENAKGGIHYISDSLKNFKKVLVVDDVVTTGATLHSCVGTLLQNKSDLEVYAAVVAMAQI